MEQELAAGLGEGQIAELVEDDEVAADELVGEPAMFVVTRGRFALGATAISGTDSVTLTW